MATVEKNGVVVDPSTGSGNTQLGVKAKVANLGNRVVKHAEFSVSAPGVDTPVKFVANHLPMAEFVEFDNGATMAVEKTGGTVTIAGTSNSASLTFTLGTGDIVTADISAIEYTASGLTTINGAEIEGDPGAASKYAFSLVLTAEANETVEEKIQQLVATCAGGQKSTISLNQTAGDPVLEVNPTSIDVPQDGTEVNVQVTTNTTFTVSAS